MELSKITKDITESKEHCIVAISGFGGSGKSTIARLLTTELSALVIGVDSFYNPKDNEDYKLWDVFDYARLEKEVIIPFHRGEKTISYGEYDWNNGKGLLYKTIDIDDILIIEGVGLLRPCLMKYFDFKIWIDCPIELAISRGKDRDRNFYGIATDENWDGLWKRNDLECFNNFKPKENADYIITNIINNEST